MKQLQRFCIFCGGPGLTKQHVWSDMLKSMIPREPSWNQSRNRYIYGAKGISKAQTKKVHRGDLLTKKFRKVCESCNSGWISEIEDRLKPVLSKLIEGSKIAITPEQQADLAIWITISTIMAEYTDPDSQVIPEQDCIYIYEHRRPPDEWLIRFGHYLGSEYFPRAYRHTYGKISDFPFTENSVKGDANYQISLHYLGQVIFQVGSSYISGKGIKERFKPGQFGEIELWPGNGQSIEWPPKSAIGDAAATAMLGRTLYSQQGSNFFKYEF